MLKGRLDWEGFCLPYQMSCFLREKYERPEKEVDLAYAGLASSHLREVLSACLNPDPLLRPSASELAFFTWIRDGPNAYGTNSLYLPPPPKSLSPPGTTATHRGCCNIA